MKASTADAKMISGYALVLAINSLAPRIKSVDNSLPVSWPVAEALQPSSLSDCDHCEFVNYQCLGTAITLNAGPTQNPEDSMVMCTEHQCFCFSFVVPQSLVEGQPLGDTMRIRQPKNQNALSFARSSKWMAA